MTLVSQNPIDQHIAGRIRLLRKKRGLSQREMAEIIQVSTQQFQKIEKAKNKLSHRQAYLFINALDLPADYFFRISK